MKNLVDRVNHLLDLANRTYETKQFTTGHFASAWVDRELFWEFRTSSLSFILNLYGNKHPYYTDYERLVRKNIPQDTLEGRAILRSIKNEIDRGWLMTMKGILSAEIFSDFLDMADHLLTEGYKDPAAVMIGSILEEHLRQLCAKFEIPIGEEKFGKMITRKADALNSDLTKNEVYNKLDQKNVTAWLDLRNKAAHGKYNDYNLQQVEFMKDGVTEFITRTKI